MPKNPHPEPSPDDPSETPSDPTGGPPQSFEPDFDFLDSEDPPTKDKPGEKTPNADADDGDQTAVEPVTAGASSDDALLLDSVESDPPDDSLILDSADSDHSNFSADALILDSVEDEGSGDSLQLDQPPDETPTKPITTSAPELPDKTGAKKPLGRIAAAAAVLLAALIPAASVYQVKQNEIKANQDEINKITEVKSKLEAQNKSLGEQTETLTEKLSKAATKAPEVNPIAEAVAMTGDQTQASAGMIKFAEYALKSEDQSAVYSFVDEVAGKVKDPQKIDDLLQACESAQKGMETTNPDLFYKMKEIRALLLEARLRMIDAQGKGANSDGGVQGQKSGAARPELPNRPEFSLRRILRVSIQAPPRAINRASLARDILKEWDDLTKAKPASINAHVGLGKACLAAGQQAFDDKNFDVAREQFDKALKAFQTARQLLGDQPAKTDPKGRISRDLIAGLDDAIQGQQKLPVSSLDPDERKKLEKERDEARTNHKTAIDDRDRARANLKTAITERDEARTNLKDALADRDNVRSNLKVALADRDQGRSNLKVALADRDQGRSNLEVALTDRDNARASLKQALADRDEARKGRGTYPSPQWPGTFAAVGDVARQSNEVGSSKPVEVPVNLPPSSANEGQVQPNVPTVPAGGLTPLEIADSAYAAGQELYNHRDYHDAEAKFAVAINANPNDARYFYLRALCRYLAAGSADVTPSNALSDLRTAIALENADKPPISDVGSALVRVQGAVRNWLESYRRPGLAEKLSVQPPVIQKP
jgi:tetratricopeptide (TPR) repeat protein